MGNSMEKRTKILQSTIRGFASSMRSLEDECSKEADAVSEDSDETDNPSTDI